MAEDRSRGPFRLWAAGMIAFEVGLALGIAALWGAGDDSRLGLLATGAVLACFAAGSLLMAAAGLWYLLRRRGGGP